MIKPEKSHMNKLFAFKSEDYNKNESKEVENNKDLKLKRKPTVEYNDNSSKNSKGSLNTRKSKIELHQSTSSEFKSEHRKSNDGSSSFLSRQSRGNYTDSEIEQTVSASPTITRQKRSSSSSRPQSFSDSLDMQAYFDKKEKQKSQASEQQEIDKKKRPVSRLMNWNRSESKSSISDEFSSFQNQETQTDDNYIENSELFLRVKHLEKENMELRTNIKDLRRQRRESTQEIQQELNVKSFINKEIKESMKDT